MKQNYVCDPSAMSSQVFSSQVFTHSEYAKHVEPFVMSNHYNKELTHACHTASHVVHGTIPTSVNQAYIPEVTNNAFDPPFNTMQSHNINLTDMIAP